MKGSFVRARLGVGQWWPWARRVGGACILSLLAAGCAYADWENCDTPVAADPDCEAPVDETPVDETPVDELPPGTIGCPLYPVEDSPRGICVPFVDVGWHFGLFRMAYIPQSELTCPASAPNAGLVGVEVPAGRSAPRNVIGCSINPFSTCPSGSGLVCVPFEPEYPPCVTQDGPQDCPQDDYPDDSRIEKDGPGGEATVCCRHLDPVP
jgi:hypothetical protein